MQSRRRLGGSLGGYISACMYHDWTLRELPFDLVKDYKNERCRHPNWRIRDVIGCRLGSDYVTAFGMPCLNACNPIGGDGRRLTTYNIGAE